MKGYKGMDENMRCRGMQFEIGKSYHVDGVIKLCKNGLHFCRCLSEVFNYYGHDGKDRYFEVETGDNVIIGVDKCVTSDLTVIRELSALGRCKDGRRSRMSKWTDPINRIIKIMLDLADLADEKKETPFGEELGLGCYAFSGYVRKGIIEVINLRSKYYSANQRAEQYKSDLTNNEELLAEIFGTMDITEYPLSDDEKGRIKAVVRELEKEWEDEEECGAKMEREVLSDD